MEPKSNTGYICNDCQTKINKFWQGKYSSLNLIDMQVKWKWKPDDNEPFAESIWCRVIEDKGETLVVTLLNDSVTGLFASGDEAEITRADIWGHVSEDHPFEKNLQEALAITADHEH